VTHQMGVNPGT